MRGIWASKGAKKSTDERERARKVLSEHKAEPLDPKLAKELDRIVAAADQAAQDGKLTHAFGGGSIGSLVEVVSSAEKHNILLFGGIKDEFNRSFNATGD